jgi:hypothetical protein
MLHLLIHPKTLKPISTPPRNCCRALNQTSSFINDGPRLVVSILSFIAKLLGPWGTKRLADSYPVACFTWPLYSDQLRYRVQASCIASVATNALAMVTFFQVYFSSRIDLLGVILER